MSTLVTREDIDLSVRKQTIYAVVKDKSFIPGNKVKCTENVWIQHADLSEE